MDLWTPSLEQSEANVEIGLLGRDSVELGSIHSPLHNPAALCSCPSAMAPLTSKLSDFFKAINFAVECEQRLMELDSAYTLSDQCDANDS